MPTIHRLTLTAVILALLSSCAAQRSASPDVFTLSIVGTNDVHGQMLPAGDRGGLVTVSAYVDALRAARAADHGAVLLIDAGDMWQGTLESNLVEGAAVVNAYNEMGFAAATIGNHEFDFGPVGSKAIPQQPGDDPRGALKQRASEADFPILAANLIDDKTGRPVEWNNVRPSIIADVNGIKVGIVGVVTERALQATISANTVGLRVAPLAETIAKEARGLRDQGASVIVVAAHAGSRCKAFDDPMDVSSCNMRGEIMRVAADLPTGLVNHIIAGHVHQGIAHIVNEISITSSYSNTRAFSRVDLEIDRESGRVVSRNVHPPTQACLSIVRSTGECATAESDPVTTTAAVYEGRAVKPNRDVLAIAERATAFAAATKEERLGVHLETAFDIPDNAESPLANLMTDALLESINADVAIHNVLGGIRNGLPAGDLTFGAVYEMFPFDNRIVVLDLSGKELREVIAEQALRIGRRAGFSGMRVFVHCVNNRLDVVMKRPDETAIRDGDRVSVIVNDYLALGGDDILAPVIPDGGFGIDDSMPLARNILLEWFRSGADALDSADFLTTQHPKWNLPDTLPRSCAL